MLSLLKSAVLDLVLALVAPIALSVGAMIGSFAAVSACVNASARILYSLSRNGLLPPAVASSHAINETPHIAVTIMSALFFVIPAALLFVPGVQLLDIVGYGGSLTAFGFIGAYFLVSVAAPAYLKREGEVHGRDYALAGRRSCERNHFSTFCSEQAEVGRR
jgi:amino acid transporter